jgi:hypothetical protein
MQVRYLQGDPRASLLEQDVPGGDVPRPSSFHHIGRQSRSFSSPQQRDLPPSLRASERDVTRVLA